jgi:thiamine pyrophosphokinase
MKIVIVCGGKAPSKKLLLEEVKDAEIIICADGGANCLYEYDIEPQFLVGDFDSISPEVLEYYKDTAVSVLTYPVEKDETDSEIAINKAFELKATEVSLLGCTGSRMDHMFGNVGLLKRCVDAGIKGVIKDDNNSVFLINQNIKLRGEYGTYFSLQAYEGSVKHLNIRGAKYPLEHYTLKVGDPITISNMFLQEQVEIEFEEGLLLAFYSKD